MKFIKDLFEFIYACYAMVQVRRFEQQTMFVKESMWCKLRHKLAEIKQKFIKKNNESNEFVDKERLALEMLLRANGNEESINEACDLIKAYGLVEGYH